MEFKNILLEKKNGVGKITINRPPLNYISIETLKEMVAALNDFRKDNEIKVVVLTGAGNRAFAAGVEVADHLGDRLPIMLEEFDNLFKALLNVDKPTIAIVNGFALGGGCEVVAGCDMAIASDKAVFGQPEIKLGVCAVVAGVFLSRLMGKNKTFELLLTGDSIDAQEAYRLGLVNKVVPAEELEKASQEFINRFLDKSGIALRLGRRALYRIADLELRKALDIAGDLGLQLMKTEDGVEGLTAFLEKRKPVWKNR